MIDLRPELLARLKGAKWDELRNGVWVYGLTEGGGVIWYVGTSVNPLSRIIEHLKGDTKDTRQKMTPQTRMILLDKVDPRQRLVAEGRWIRNTGSANKIRYDKLVARNDVWASVLEQTLSDLGLE